MSKAQTLVGEATLMLLCSYNAQPRFTPHNKPILSLTLNLLFRSLLDGRTVLNTYLT